VPYAAAAHAIVTADGSAWIGDLRRGADTWALLWDARRRERAVTVVRRATTGQTFVATHTGSVWTRAVEGPTPSGTLVATDGSAGWQRLWNGERGEAAVSLISHPSSATVAIVTSAGSVWAAVGPSHEWFDRYWDGSRQPRALRLRFTPDGRDLFVRTADGAGWVRSTEEGAWWAKGWDSQRHGPAVDIDVAAGPLAGPGEDRRLRGVAVSADGVVWLSRHVAQNARWDRRWDDRLGPADAATLTDGAARAMVRTAAGWVVDIEIRSTPTPPAVLWSTADHPPAVRVITRHPALSPLVIDADGSLHGPLSRSDGAGARQGWSVLWDGAADGAVRSVVSLDDSTMAVTTAEGVAVLDLTDLHVGPAAPLPRDITSEIARVVPLSWLPAAG
jgi:hypothetical protein